MDNVFEGIELSPCGRLVGCEMEPGIIGVWELATGERLLRFDSGIQGVDSLSFGPDGRTLASGGDDTTVLIWDLAPPGWANKAASYEWNPKSAEGLWDRLALGKGDDALKAYEAVWILSAAEDKAVEFLEGRLKARPKEDPERLRRLIEDLDDPEVDVRERVQEELRLLGYRAVWDLHEALEEGVSPEERSRVKSLLEEIGSTVRFTDYPSEPLRRLRAIWVLEKIGSKKARDVLHWTVDQSPFYRERLEAAAALRRLEIRQSSE